MCKHNFLKNANRYFKQGKSAEPLQSKIVRKVSGLISAAENFGFHG
jgi:hypothetical protein